ncbi:MAG: hypothetical protein ABIY90_19170 [Puia sp.]
MIGYFLKSGDETVSDMFSPYLWMDYGFSTLFEKRFSEKSYGNDLTLLLIKYYVEGKFEINGPRNLKVNNYLKKDKDISVDIAVRENQFHKRSEIERRKFIVDSTRSAVTNVRKKLENKNFSCNFGELLSDLNVISEEYLGV